MFVQPVTSLSWKFVAFGRLFPNPQVAVLILNVSILKEDTEDTILKIRELDTNWYHESHQAFQPDCRERQTFTSGESSAKEKNEGNISKVRMLDIQAQTDIMNLIFQFE